MTRRPAEVWPLATFVADEMQARGWKSTDVARRMNADGEFTLVDLLSVELLLAVQDENLRMDRETLAGLSRAFNVSEEYFVNLDKAWRDNPDARVQWTCPESLLSDRGH